MTKSNWHHAISKSSIKLSRRDSFQLVAIFIAGDNGMSSMQQCHPLNAAIILTSRFYQYPVFDGHLLRVISHRRWRFLYDDALDTILWFIKARHDYADDFHGRVSVLHLGNRWSRRGCIDIAGNRFDELGSNESHYFCIIADLIWADSQILVWRTAMISSKCKRPIDAYRIDGLSVPSTCTLALCGADARRHRADIRSV